MTSRSNPESSTEQVPVNPKLLAADIARELRANPSAWTQHYYAKNSKGQTVPCDDPSAICWCLYGHIDKRTTVSEVIRSELEEIFTRHVSDGISDWNDHFERTVDDVIELCDRVAQS